MNKLNKVWLFGWLLKPIFFIWYFYNAKLWSIYEWLWGISSSFNDWYVIPEFTYEDIDGKMTPIPKWRNDTVFDEFFHRKAIYHVKISWNAYDVWKSNYIHNKEEMEIFNGFLKIKLEKRKKRQREMFENECFYGEIIEWEEMPKDYPLWVYGAIHSGYNKGLDKYWVKYQIYRNATELWQGIKEYYWDRINKRQDESTVI